MKWFKKQLYSKGANSPGGTAKIIADSFRIQTNQGLTNEKSCETILEQYLFTFSQMGFDVPDTLLASIKNNLNGNIVATTFTIIILSNMPMPKNLEIIINDKEIILEVIADKQQFALKHSSHSSSLPISQCNAIMDMIFEYEPEDFFSSGNPIM